METTLAAAVAELAAATQALPDVALERDYTWRYHEEGLRFALIGSYHELRTLAVDLAAARSARGPAITIAQRVLGQYHGGYRDLQALLLGADDATAQRAPAPEEWPIAATLGHMHDTARQFFGRCWHAAEMQRAGVTEPLEMDDEALAAFAGPSIAHESATSTLEAVRARFDALHARILAELSPISDAETLVPSLWWEDEPIPVRYRLQRFDAHLRQHTIQIEKIREALGMPLTEAQRLLRYSFAALAEVEASTLGTDDLLNDEREAAARVIAARARTL